MIFARTERKITKLRLRDGDSNIDQTRNAIENALAMCADRVACKFSLRRKWEVDLVRFLLGYTTSREEQEFNSMCRDHNRMRSDPTTVTKRIGKAMTAVLRHLVNLFDALFSFVKSIGSACRWSCFCCFVGRQ